MSLIGKNIVRDFQKANKIVETGDGQNAIGEVVVVLQEVGAILLARLGEQRFEKVKENISFETEKLYFSTRKFFSTEGIEWSALDKINKNKIEENVNKFLTITESPPQSFKVATLVFIFFLIIVLMFFIRGLIEGNEKLIAEMLFANYNETLKQNVNRSVSSKVVGFAARFWTFFQEKVSNIADTSVDGLEVIQAVSREEPLRAVKRGAKFISRISQPLETYDLSQYRNATTEQISKENNLWNSVFTALVACLLVILAFLGKEFFEVIKTLIRTSPPQKTPSPSPPRSRSPRKPRTSSPSPKRKPSPSPIRQSPLLPEGFDIPLDEEERQSGTIPAGTGTLSGRADPFGIFISKYFKIGDAVETDYKTIFKGIPEYESTLVQSMRTKADKYNLVKKFLIEAKLKCSNLTLNALEKIRNRIIEENKITDFPTVGKTKVELCRNLMTLYEMLD